MYERNLVTAVVLVRVSTLETQNIEIRNNLTEFFVIMTKCCVYKCKSNSKKDEQSVLVHRFPKNPRLKTQWLYRMKNSNWKPTVNSVICDNHFTPESFLLPCQNFDSKGRQRKKKRLHADAVPTLFWYNSDKNTSGRKTINSRKAPPPVEM
jgi:hypothetical protein